MYKMKLTETKLKQMIREMMTTGRLVHGGKPALSENGKKIEELLLSQKGDLIYQAESLLDGISSLLDPLEADYLDALSISAVATVKLKQLENEERKRLSIPFDQRPPRNMDYGHAYNATRKDFVDSFDRLMKILGQDGSKEIYRNFQGIVV
jgi:hypothetical protein